MKKIFVTLVSTTMLVSGCASFGNHKSLSEYCQENRAVCVLAGLAIAGGVILIASNNDNDGFSGTANPGGGGGTRPGGGGSDLRLKEDVRYLTTLDNGLRIYAFRYRGDQRYFTGVLAQDVAANPKFAHAVNQGAHGFLMVDYAKLGLEIHNADAMRTASEKAIDLAS